MKLKKIILAAIVFFLISIEIGLPGTGNSFKQYNIEKSVSLPIIATTTDMSKGVSGKVIISMLDSEEMLLFTDNIIIDQSTYLAAQHAIEFAEEYAGKKAGFLITYELPAHSASGGSSGSAIAAGAIALLTDAQLKEDTIITGEIDSSGNLMKTGALPIKAAAAGSSGFSRMLIPNGQSKFLVHEQQAQDGLSDGSHFIVKEYDLKVFMKEKYDTDIIEIANMKNALIYILI